MLSSCFCCWATWVRSDPDLLLPPLRHTPTASPLSHSFPLLPSLSPLYSPFFWFAIQPAVLLCFISFPNKQQAIFLFFFFTFLKRNFSCSWYTHGLVLLVCKREREQWTTNDSQYVKLGKARLQLSSWYTWLHSCVVVKNKNQIATNLYNGVFIVSALL